MTILAIDPGTRCGWAMLHNDDSVSSGVWLLKPKSHEPDGLRPLGLMQQMAAVDEGDLELVAFEQVRRHAGSTAAHVYGELVGALKCYCCAKGIPYKGIEVSTIKMRATGKGNADKPAMVKSAREQWPSQAIRNDDQADALWILQCATEGV